MSMNIKDIDTKTQDEQLRNSLYLINAIKNRIGDTKCKNGVTILNEDKLKYLVENYNKLPLDVISEKIKKKPNTIRKIAERLRLTSVYLEDDEYVLYNLLNKLGIKNGDYILKVMVRYGLPVQKQGAWSTIKLPLFWDWLIEHLNINSFHNYVVGTLPNEPDWFIEKVQADKRAYVYIFKRKWTNDEDNQLKQMVAERKTYLEISSALKRTGSAIKRRCTDLKIAKPRRTPPKPWTTKQVETMRTLWLKGYIPCIIAEEIGRSDREVQSYLERKNVNYYGQPPLKFKV